MTRLLLQRLPLVVLLTVGAGVVVLATPLEAGIAIRAYLLALGAVALATFAGAAAAAVPRRPSAFAAALRPPRAPTRRPEELERLERQVSLGVENATDFHFRVRPQLAAIADAAVWRRHGVGLERAQHLLPREVWELVDPGAEPPADRHGPGPSLDRLRAFVDAIERMRE